jgi:uncharacterized protein YjbI with pentapeptide repeats
LLDADLEDAALSDADCTRANFKFVNLRGADLRGANLTGADLFRADLTSCSFNQGTRLPDGVNWSPGTDLLQYGVIIGGAMAEREA